MERDLPARQPLRQIQLALFGQLHISHGPAANLASDVAEAEVWPPFHTQREVQRRHQRVLELFGPHCHLAVH